MYAQYRTTGYIYWTRVNFPFIYCSWRTLLTLSLINSLYIISGFLLNFKEISRFVYNCCDIQEPFTGKYFYIIKKYKKIFILYVITYYVPFSKIIFYREFAGISEWKLTYDIWSFVLLIAEPFLRPLASISFYFKYLYSDPLSDGY